MTLSKLIREYVELKIEGEPEHTEWSSCDWLYARRTDYRERLAELEYAIDEIIDLKVGA